MQFDFFHAGEELAGSSSIRGGHGSLIRRWRSRLDLLEAWTNRVERPGCDALGHDHGDAIRDDVPGDMADDRGAGPVSPLDVVENDQNRLIAAQFRQDRKNIGGDLDDRRRLGCRAASERRSQCRRPLGNAVGSKIGSQERGQRTVGKIRFDRDAGDRAHVEAGGLSLLDGEMHECCFADTGYPTQDQPGASSLGGAAEKSVDTGR